MDYSGFRRSQNVEDYQDQSSVLGYLKQSAQDWQNAMSDLWFHPFTPAYQQPRRNEWATVPYTGPQSLSDQAGLNSAYWKSPGLIDQPALLWATINQGQGK